MAGALLATALLGDSVDKGVRRARVPRTLLDLLTPTLVWLEAHLNCLRRLLAFASLLPYREPHSREVKFRPCWRYCSET